MKQLIPYSGSPSDRVVKFPGPPQPRSFAKRINSARKMPRQQKIGFARVFFDDKEVLCGLLDLTGHGAKLTSRFAEEFPMRFSVSVGRKTDGHTRRRKARLIWRR